PRLQDRFPVDTMVPAPGARRHFDSDPSKGGRTMTTPLQSLVACGTKLWLDSVDPDEVARNRAWGATGATSNPIIIADLIKTGQFDEALNRFGREGLSDVDVAWRVTDMLVRQAQEVFFPAWQASAGDDGYV